MPPRHITIRGARTHNLQDINADIPRDALTVITGPSGSGKSSLAFDTLFAESQRRFIESLSVHARQYLERWPRPDADAIDGLSPALAIEQKPAIVSPRSTVGTATEINDFLRLFFARAGIMHCRLCNAPMSRSSPSQMASRLMKLPPGTRVTLLAPIVSRQTGDLTPELEHLQREGFARARINGQLHDIGEPFPFRPGVPHSLEVLIDRAVIRDDARARLADSLELALKWGRGAVIAAPEGAPEFTMTERLRCPEHGGDYPALEPQLFSPNSPKGACPACEGLGHVRRIDPALLLRDDALTPAELAGQILGGQALEKFLATLDAWAKGKKLNPNQPLADLDPPIQAAIAGGERTSGAFPGLIGTLETYAQSGAAPAARRELERFTVRDPCPTCGGARLRPEALAVRVHGTSIATLLSAPVSQAIELLRALPLTPHENEIAGPLCQEIVTRLGFLMDFGLGYLHLGRETATLSSGEGQRIRLAAQLGAAMTGVTYVLDEPSIGLHVRDHEKLLGLLAQLRAAGNTVIIVEHDPAAMEAAGWLIELGPGAGAQGGRIIAQGPPAAVKSNPKSVTGAWLSGRDRIAPPAKRRTPRAWVELAGCTAHNLREITGRVPIGTLCAVTGVSGAGKSSLILDSLVPALAAQAAGAPLPAHTGPLRGAGAVARVLTVDQSPIGRTPRSIPASYMGVLGPLRELFAGLPEARVRGWDAGRFSFNVKGGRCEVCEGHGTIRIGMAFLPDVQVTCEACEGTRFTPETLAIHYKGRNFAEVLDLSAADAFALFRAVTPIAERMDALVQAGIGYLRLGQPAASLSGGETQRLKLARELAKPRNQPTLFALDEPTTGLFFTDVAHLLRLLDRLIDQGHSIAVIEHHLDVLGYADWIIELGPGAGPEGGRIIAEGPPEALAANPASVTGPYLREWLAKRAAPAPPRRPPGRKRTRAN